MAKVCPNCKNYNLSDANFCEYCGTNISGVQDTHKTSPDQRSKKNIIDEGMEWFNNQSTAIKAVLGVVGVCFIGIILILAIGGLTPEQNNTVTVKNVKITSDKYGGQDVTAIITPNKDFRYLEMQLIWYDANNAIIDKESLAWNINDVKAGQQIQASASTYLKIKPAKVDMLIYDTGLAGNSTKPIFKQTYNING